jgi:tetratricopeptide (TPR) repeat protein
MLDEAEREFTRSLDLDPTRFEARFGLAAIEMRRGRHREALRRLMEMIGEGRLAPSVFLNLALCLESIGRVPHALVTVEEGLRSFPGNPPLLLSHAILLTKSRRPAAAIRAFEAFSAAQGRTAIAPADYFAFYGLALAATGELEAASERLEDGLRFYPHAHVLLLHAAVVHERMNRLERAFHLFERALQEAPRSAQARRGLADTLYRSGRLDEAAELYHGLFAESGGAELQFRLGSIAYERGNRTEAVEYWRGALQTDPTHLQARTRLRLIDAGMQPTVR